MLLVIAQTVILGVILLLIDIDAGHLSINVLITHQTPGEMVLTNAAFSIVVLKVCFIICFVILCGDILSVLLFGHVGATGDFIGVNLNLGIIMSSSVPCVFFVDALF